MPGIACAMARAMLVTVFATGILPCCTYRFSGEISSWGMFLGGFGQSKPSSFVWCVCVVVL